MSKSLEEITISGALSERRKSDGRRRIRLNEEEREAFFERQQVERAVTMFLDLEHAYSWREISQELGLSIRQLKDLTKSDLFNDVYNEHFQELGHDPRLKASQAAITDLLTTAVNQLKQLLIAADTPASVRYNAIVKVLELNGITAQKGGANDKQQLANFLKEAGVNLTQNNTQNNITVQVPEEYRQGIQQYEETIDGEILPGRDVQKVQPGVAADPE